MSSLISTPNSWQAYYWWIDDARAPKFARTVDIHRKPGYDPVELHFDIATKSIPLDATLVKGSHGAPARDASQRGVLLHRSAACWKARQWPTPMCATSCCGSLGFSVSTATQRRPSPTCCIPGHHRAFLTPRPLDHKCQPQKAD